MVTCSSLGPAGIATCWYSTSRACIRASSGPSISTLSDSGRDRASCFSSRRRPTTGSSHPTTRRSCATTASCQQYSIVFSQHGKRRSRAAIASPARRSRILMNSFYGVLGTPSCRFCRPEIAGAITAFGREILLRTKSELEARGFEVLYGDTDSLFVLAGTDSPRRRLGARSEAGDGDQSRAGRVDRRALGGSRARSSCSSRSSSSSWCCRRCAAAAAALESDMSACSRMVRSFSSAWEVVRRDWTELARSVQRELYRRLFDGEPVDDYLAEVVAELRAGGHDDRLIYRKALRKPLDEYRTTRSAPRGRGAQALRAARPPHRVRSHQGRCRAGGGAARVARSRALCRTADPPRSPSRSFRFSASTSPR